MEPSYFCDEAICWGGKLQRVLVLPNKLYCIVFVFELDAILHRVCDKIRKIRIGLFATLQFNSTYIHTQHHKVFPVLN